MYIINIIISTLVQNYHQFYEGKSFKPHFLKNYEVRNLFDKITQNQILISYYNCTQYIQINEYYANTQAREHRFSISYLNFRFNKGELFTSN